MSETVTIACKLPNGMVLRLFQMTERAEQVLGGGQRKVKQAALIDRAPITIKGCATPFGVALQTFGGYALTTGVDKEFWEEWVKQNADSDILKNNLMFVQGDEYRAADQAKEQAEITSGLQPLNPDKDIRAPKRVTKDDSKHLAA